MKLLINIRSIGSKSFEIDPVRISINLEKDIDSAFMEGLIFKIEQQVNLLYAELIGEATVKTNEVGLRYLIANRFACAGLECSKRSENIRQLVISLRSDFEQESNRLDKRINSLYDVIKSKRKVSV